MGTAKQKKAAKEILEEKKNAEKNGKSFILKINSKNNSASIITRK